MEDTFTKYFSDKLQKMDVLNKAELKVVFRDDIDIGAGAAFDHPNSRANEIVPQVEPLPDGSIRIYVFKSEEDLEYLYGSSSAIESLATFLIHEFVHAVQWSKAKDFKPLFLYHGNRKRETVGGVRKGKRGGDTNKVSLAAGMPYYSLDIEIDAHAASAAAEVIYAIKKQSPERQKAALNDALRSLRVMSGTITNYREMFNRFFSGFLNKNAAKAASLKKMKANVWNRFRLKLAKHLMEYLETL